VQYACGDIHLHQLVVKRISYNAIVLKVALKHGEHEGEKI